MLNNFPYTKPESFSTGADEGLILSNLPLPVWQSAVNSRFSYFNNCWLEYTGRELQEECGMGWCESIHPDDVENFVHGYLESFSQRTPIDLSLRLKGADGQYRSFSFSGRPYYNDSGKFLGYSGYAREITGMLQETQRLKSLIREKEMLLKECHHRIKNNLQIVSSMLALQSDSIQEQSVLRQFNDGQNRIKTMSLIHEFLYRSESLNKIDFSEYVYKLINSLYYSFCSDRHVKLKFESERIDLGVETATPCGLIINELISNSFKYAFDGCPEPELTVRLSLMHKGNLQMLISDNGKGLPEHMDIYNTGTLGLQLVTGLAEQIKSTIKLNRHSGTEYIFEFPAGAEDQKS